MSTKSKVLEKLEEFKYDFISGEKLAKDLGVSRTSIWKAIKALENDGYKIKSVSKKGYTLIDTNDKLSAEGIKVYLKDKDEYNIFVFDTVNSTNIEAKKLGIEGYKNKTIVVSDEQSNGRGRFGRTFVSPKGKGIYLSLIIKPENMNISDVSFSTILTVVGVFRALNKLTKQNIKIKWVNDLYIDNKKVSGILTELISDVESGNIDFIVSGIGININASTDDFPDELKDIVSSIKLENITRNELIAKITNEIYSIFLNFDKKEIIKEYKNNQLLLGKFIHYEKNGEHKEGTVIDINQDGCLVVEVDNKIEELNSGEVSIQWNRKK